MTLCLRTDTAEALVVTGVAAPFVATLVRGQRYAFASTTSCWVRQSAAGTAAAARTNLNTYLPAGAIVTFAGEGGAKISVIRDTDDVDGVASLTKITGY